jgi:hypothetical protein
MILKSGGSSWLLRIKSQARRFYSAPRTHAIGNQMSALANKVAIITGASSGIARAASGE